MARRGAVEPDWIGVIDGHGEYLILQVHIQVSGGRGRGQGPSQLEWEPVGCNLRRFPVEGVK